MIGSWRFTLMHQWTSNGRSGRSSCTGWRRHWAAAHGDAAPAPCRRHPVHEDRPLRPLLVHWCIKVKRQLPIMVVHGQKGDATVAALPARDEDLHLKGDGKYEASVVVGVLTDQVDAPGGTSQALGFGAEDVPEAIQQSIPGWASGGSGRGRRSAHDEASPPSAVARSSAAFSSALVSLRYCPAPASTPARYFSLSAVRY